MGTYRSSLLLIVGVPLLLLVGCQHVDPVAQFTVGSVFSVVGQEVSFDGSGSRAPGSNIIEYLWDFGDSSKAKGRKVIHQYQLPGNYTVALKVSNANGRSDTASKTVLVLPKP